MDTPPVREAEKSRHLQRNISERLKQSIHLLDSSIGSSIGSSSILRTSRSLHTSKSYTPRYTRNAPFDVSTFMATTPSSRMSSFNMTYSRAPSAYNKSVDQDMGKGVVELIDESNPGVAATESIYDNFLDSLLSNPSKNEVFDLLESYASSCHHYGGILGALIKRLPAGQSKSHQSNRLRYFLMQEANTWELIQTLYSERLQVDSNAIEVEMLPLDVAAQKMSPKTFVNHLYEQDTNLKQNQLVVDWLEMIAARELEEDSHLGLEHFTDKCVAWEYTLGLLHKSRHQPDQFLNQNMISQMDPDAPLRQGKPIADMDKEDDDNFLRCLFLYIRTGQFDKAERLCEKCGQFWRIPTLQGWRLHHDPNYEGLLPGGQAKPIEGNRYRDIWKATCWAVSQEEGLPLYERAMLGILCGNREAVLKVCSSWEEYLWAHYRCMIDTKVEQEIRSNIIQPQGYQELPPEYWNQLLTVEGIFQQLKASTNENIQKDNREPFHIIQKCIILDDIEGLIEELYEMTKTKHNPSPHLLRFATHLVIFLRTIGRCSKEELCVSMLENYVKFLVDRRKINLVPSYTFNLPQQLQITCYAAFLEGIEDGDERQLCLKLANEVGLDVPVITKMLVENIRSRPDSQVALVDSELQVQTSEDDWKKVNAVDWLVFDPTMRGEALRQANALMRTFLACHKLNAVQAVFTKIPPDSIAIIHSECKMQIGCDMLSASDDNAIREYLCFQAYLQSQDSFNDWFEHFHNGKPEHPQLAPGASFTDRIVHEHREKEYQSDRERWQHTLDLQTSNTVGMMYNVLLFVDGGWMVDQREEEDEEAIDAQRTLQLQRLREICLPQITLMLHSVLIATSQHRECLQLADVINSERHQLYKVFRKPDLHRFLQKISESSVMLMNSNLDPFGYPCK